MFMIALFAFTCVFRVLYVYGAPLTPDSVWSNTLTRLDPFALGGLLAILLHNRNVAFSRLVRGCILFAGIGLFWYLGTFLFAGKFFLAPAWSYPIAAVASVLCILAFVSAPQRLAFSLPLRALSYLGKISYGLYVFHYPAILLSHSILPETAQDDWLWVHRTTLAALMTLVAATVSYECLEKPFLRLKKRFSYVESRPA
jgi:peptidoglycan/LPS O-acetylase OafA/YrhL